MMQPLQKESLMKILSIVFIVTFIIPAISIGTLRLSNFITDLGMEDRKQRITPFLFVTMFYGITAYMFYTKLQINNLIFIVFATTTVLIFILTTITFFWKISVHGAGIGGVIGFVLAIKFSYPLPHFAVILAAMTYISGMIVYARLALNMHTPTQVYAGVILGMILCYTSLHMLL